MPLFSPGDFNLPDRPAGSSFSTGSHGNIISETDGEQNVNVKALADAVAIQNKSGNEIDPATETSLSKVHELLKNGDTLNAIQYNTSSTSAEQLPSNQVPNKGSILVIPLRSNAGDIYLGDSNIQPVTMTNPTDRFNTSVSNTDEIYVKTPSSGDGVAVLWES